MTAETAEYGRDVMALIDVLEAARAYMAQLEKEVDEQSKEVTNAQWALRRAGEQEDALRARVARLEADIPLKWQARQDEMQATIDALRARVAKLEGALKDCKRYAEDYNDGSIPHLVDTALKDAPE